MRLLPSIAIAALLPAAALAAPPEGSMRLSEVVAALETSVGDQLRYVEEVEWDDDGYWDVEYRTTDGAKVEVRLDPASGEVRQRD